MNNTILVIGSSNTDMVVKTERFPRQGETVLGGTFFMNAGGKGANQAVAAARLGGAVIFITKTGDDVFGRQAIDVFRKEGINTSYILTDSKTPSGVALITVDQLGENSIVVASGANATLATGDFKNLESILDSCSILLMQLEIPLETVMHTASLAVAKNKKVVLNPAPGCMLPDGLLKNVSIITPNEIEAELLTRIKIQTIAHAEKAARVLHQKGVETVIITLGAKGALVLHQNEVTVIPTIEVAPIDTTAAGDIFNGALVVALAEGKTMQEAVAFGCKAAAISVTRLGAQASCPHRHEVDGRFNFYEALIK